MTAKRRVERLKRSAKPWIRIRMVCPSMGIAISWPTEPLITLCLYHLSPSLSSSVTHVWCFVISNYRWSDLATLKAPPSKIQSHKTNQAPPSVSSHRNCNPLSKTDPFDSRLAFAVCFLLSGPVQFGSVRLFVFPGQSTFFWPFENFVIELGP